MHGTIGSAEKPAEVKKRRTITLTNARPIQIIEDEWPEVAAGGACDHGPGYGPWSWSIDIKVRRLAGDNYSHTIIYGVFSAGEDDDSQLVRVGRYIFIENKDLEKNIVEVGEEMRERIDDEKLRRHVTHAVDHCIASLPAKVL